MKKILLLTAVIMTMSGNAYSHPNRTHSKHYDTVTHQTVSYHWVYVAAKYVNGHWVTGHWKKITGPHPHANHSDWHFVKGHHARINGHRVWVHGYWTKSHNKSRKNNKRRR